MTTFEQAENTVFENHYNKSHFDPFGFEKIGGRDPQFFMSIRTLPSVHKSENL